MISSFRRVNLLHHSYQSLKTLLLVKLPLKRKRRSVRTSNVFRFTYLFYFSIESCDFYFYFYISVSNILQDPFLNIAPKKPNWDLRRDVQKKLDKLEKRTQKAIFQLMGMLICASYLCFLLLFLPTW